MRRLSVAAVVILAGFFAASGTAAQSATALFGQAQAEAQREHKDILMVFSASWCGPCRKYEQFLDDQQMKAITDRAFVVVRIDVGEEYGRDKSRQNTPGGEQLRTELGAVGEPGFPFIVITDTRGKPVVNSYRDGNKDANIGYPALPEEIAWYGTMLQRVPGLSAADVAATRGWLLQHSGH